MNLISVIILTYNNDNYIDRSIESIINQSFKKWKLIIVNDGSSDNTSTIIHQYKKILNKKLIYINNIKNLGINHSMNKALEFVDTPFFTRQDGDDISDKFRLEILFNELQAQKNFDFVSSKMQSLIDKNLIFPKKFISFPQNLDMLKGISFCNAPTLFNSRVLKKVKGYNKSNIYKKRFEDYEFFYQLYYNGFKGFNVNQVTYYVRQDKYYYKKISLNDRFIEFKLKIKIFKDLNINIIYFYVIFFPIIKILVPKKFKIYF